MDRKMLNDHYGLLNARFEERSKLLWSKGWRYKHVPEYGIAVFLKPGRKDAITASEVMLADTICWRETVSTKLEG